MKLALGYVILLLAFTGAKDIIGSSKCELETSEPGRRGICTKCKYDEDDGVGCYGSGHNEQVSRCIDGRCMLYPQGNVKKGNVCRLCNGDRVAEVVQAVENEYRVAYVVEAKENEQKTSAEYKQCLGNCNDADYKNIVECRDRLGGLFGCLIMCKSKCKAQCKFQCVSWAANRNMLRGCDHEGDGRKTIRRCSSLDDVRECESKEGPGDEGDHGAADDEGIDGI